MEPKSGNENEKADGKREKEKPREAIDEVKLQDARSLLTLEKSLQEMGITTWKVNSYNSSVEINKTDDLSLDGYSQSSLDANESVDELLDVLPAAIKNALNNSREDWAKLGMIIVGKTLHAYDGSWFTRGKYMMDFDLDKPTQVVQQLIALKIDKGTINQTAAEKLPELQAKIRKYQAEYK